MILPTVTLTRDMHNIESEDCLDRNITLVWEVLTVHFEKGTMRVRTTYNGKKEVYNFDATPFFEKYLISDRVAT